MSIKELQAEQQPIEIQQVIAQFKTIEKALIESTPNLPEALATIHKHLQTHEELIHLFDDEEFAAIHQSFEKFKMVTIVTKSKKASSAKRKLSDNDLNGL